MDKRPDANSKPPSPVGRLGCYRVEHRGPAGTVVLHEADVCHAHHRALERYAAQLILSGQTEGELVLVDPQTGAVVARRRVRPIPRRRPTP